MTRVFLFASHGGELFGFMFLVAGVFALGASVAIFKWLYRVRPSALLRVLGGTYGLGALILVCASVLYSSPIFIFMVPVTYVAFVILLLLGVIQLIAGLPKSLR